MWCLSLLAFLSGKQLVCRQVLWKHPRHYTTCGTLKQQESNLAVKQAWRTGLRICWNINICWRKPGGPREPESGLKQGPVFIGQIGLLQKLATDSPLWEEMTRQMLPMWPTMNSSGSSRCALTHHSAVKPDKWRSSHGTKFHSCQHGGFQQQRRRISNMWKGHRPWKWIIGSQSRIEISIQSLLNLNFLLDGSGAAPAQRWCDPARGLAPAFCNRCSCGCAGL